MDTLQVTEWTADKVDRAAKEVGISIKRLAEQSGIAYNTLWRKMYSKNKTPFNWAELLLIAETLEMNPAHFTPPIFRAEAEKEKSQLFTV